MKVWAIIATGGTICVPLAESVLASRDPTLGRVIASRSERWSSQATETPIWGLLRIIMAQQISTAAACRMAGKVKAAYPLLHEGDFTAYPGVQALRALGLPERRAACCVTVLRMSGKICDAVTKGQTWDQALAGIKGIGPWTRSVFRIMVLREPDVLPLRDIGLERAITNVYGRRRNVVRLAESWRPYRSVACWYLWRTLGNRQLG